MKLFRKIKQLFCDHKFVMLPGSDMYLTISDMHEKKLSREYIMECTCCGAKIYMVKRWSTIDEDILDEVHTKLRYYKKPEPISSNVRNIVDELNLHKNYNSNINNSKDPIDDLSKKNKLVTKAEARANLYSINYDIDIDKFKGADYDEVKLVVIREYLRGERYIIPDITTQEEENEFKYELGYNRMVDKAIQFIDEITDNKFKHLSEPTI